MNVREYDVVVRLRVATYESDLEVRKFAERVARAVRGCSTASGFIVEPCPKVEVKYDPRT